MDKQRKESKRARKWLIIEILLFAILYAMFGFSETGWGLFGVFLSFFCWVCINMIIGISDPMSDPYDD